VESILRQFCRNTFKVKEPPGSEGHPLARVRGKAGLTCDACTGRAPAGMAGGRDAGKCTGRERLPGCNGIQPLLIAHKQGFGPIATLYKVIGHKSGATIGLRRAGRMADVLQHGRNGRRYAVMQTTALWGCVHRNRQTVTLSPSEADGGRRSKGAARRRIETSGRVRR
jgi:hypothetical protein